jgi:hypothetical protein
MQGWVADFTFKRKHTTMIDLDTETAKIDFAAKIDQAIKTTQANTQLLTNKKVEFERGIKLIHDLVDRKFIPNKLKFFIEDFWSDAYHNNHSAAVENGQTLWQLYNGFTAAFTHATNRKGQNLSSQRQYDLGTKTTDLFLKLVKQAA